MKKFTFVFALALLVSTFTFAQEYKKFKVGIGLGYAMASGEGSSGGVLFAVEPAYRIQDNFSVGLRMEAAVITRGYSESIGSASLGVAGISSYTLNGQYYFGSSSFRPFLGAGLGMYSCAAVSFSNSSGGTNVSGDAAAAETKFGFYPRAGFDLGHFNVTLDYNLVPSTKDALGGGGEFKNNYFGFRFGAFFGGGKK